MIYDLAVVGGGYWGTATAYESRLRGYNTILLDNADSLGASRNAAGITHQGIYYSQAIQRRWPEQWNFSELDDSFVWLAMHCGLVKTGELFLNHMIHSTVKKYREDLYCLPTNQALLGLFPTTHFVVQRLYKTNGYWTIWGKGNSIDSIRVVLAAGWWTDTILRASGLPPVGLTGLKGTGLLLNTQNTYPVPVTILIRPYVKYTLRQWDINTVHLGDTAEAVDKPSKLSDLEMTSSLLLDKGYHVKDYLGGIRPVTDKFTIREITDNLVVATGGYRVGLGLSGLVANKVLQLLEANK